MLRPEVNGIAIWRKKQLDYSLSISEAIVDEAVYNLTEISSS